MKLKLICITIIGCVLVCVTIFSRASKEDLSEAMGLHIPANSKIISGDKSVVNLDGEISALLSLSDHEYFLHEVSLSYRVLEISDDSYSKYQEVISMFRSIYPNDIDRFIGGRAFIGGPNGNSFVCFSTSGNEAILYRFWT